ncbi:hypothetical protein MLD38_033557 [Melastoma candidum]|uniref:Uncharacterized protein n=1 Tax=Melastoma candidum TaxID=119954 RepID=A0ACB9M7L7_9MYRT|nr:hypothetical protein MLD38_033557 [Melastoma candidum]
MAAVAYDVAALTLKGPAATLNFPDLILTYPIPASTSAADIRAAASRAAEAGPLEAAALYGNVPERTFEDGIASDYIDEDMFLNMPDLLAEMAEGMLMSPPRTRSVMSETEELMEYYSCLGGGDLWSYE